MPARVRQALDVESGLNDGVAVPFFLVALDLSMATLIGGVPSAVVSNLASQIGWGLVAGVGAGAIGGYVLRQVGRARVAPVAVASDVHARRGAERVRGSSALGGSGFIAAFVAGMAFGWVSRRARAAHDVPHRGSGQHPGGGDLDGFRRGGDQQGASRTSPGRWCCTRF